MVRCRFFLFTLTIEILLNERIPLCRKYFNSPNHLLLFFTIFWTGQSFKISAPYFIPPLKNSTIYNWNKKLCKSNSIKRDICNGFCVKLKTKKFTWYDPVYSISNFFWFIVICRYDFSWDRYFPSNRLASHDTFIFLF